MMKRPDLSITKFEYSLPFPAFKFSAYCAFDCRIAKVAWGNFRSTLSCDYRLFQIKVKRRLPRPRSVRAGLGVAFSSYRRCIRRKCSALALARHLRSSFCTAGILPASWLPAAGRPTLCGFALSKGWAFLFWSWT